MKKSTKSIKSISLIFLAIVLAFSSLPFTSYAEELTTGSCGENATYSFDSTTGTLTISGTGDTANYNSTAQPWNDIKSKIKSIIVQDGITSVGDYAFYNCVNVENIQLPSGITYIGNSAFNNFQKIIEIVIPDTVKTIGKSAFSNNWKLEMIIIPSLVESIGQWAFSDCFSNQKITVDENNNYFCDIDGVLYNKDVTELIKYPDGKTDSSYSTPETLEIIDEDAIDTAKLMNLHISKNVSNITLQNKSLSSISLATRKVLQSITVDVNNNYYSSQDGVLFNKDKTELLLFPGGNSEIIEYNVPDSVKTIFEYAFYMAELSNIIIPDSVETIGESAFFLAKLIEVVIPDSVTSMGVGAFNGCPNLERVKLGKNLTEISSSCFDKCTSLTDVVIPASVTKLNYYCFRGCESLEFFTVLNSDCVFQGSLSFNETITLYGLYNSTLQTFAEENGYNFKIVCSDGTENHEFELTDYNITSCTTAEESYVCSKCGYSYSESVETISHEYVENIVSPTCTQQGYTEYVCQNCGDIYQDNYTDAVGHNFSDGEQFCLNGCGEDNPDYKSETEETTVSDNKTTTTGPTTAPGKNVSTTKSTTNADSDITITKNRKKSSKKTAKDTYADLKETSYDKYRIIPGYGQIKAAWTVDSKLEGYEIYVSTDNKHFKKNCRRENKKASFCIIDNLKAGTVYYVKIKGYLHHNGKKIVMNESKVQALTVK